MKYHVCAPDNNLVFCFFFFNDTATTEIYTLSLHDALPISDAGPWDMGSSGSQTTFNNGRAHVDRKSTRLNSSHPSISYAVFCLKKQTQYEWQPLAPGRGFNAGSDLHGVSYS